MNFDNQPQPESRPEDDASHVARELTEMINDATSPEAGIRLAALYNEFGSAAIAYAQLPDVDPNHAELRRNFTNVYVRSWPDRQTFLDMELHDLDWKPEVERIVRRLGIPDGVLEWNEQAIWGALHEMYDIVDYGGQTHVFWT